MKKQDGYKLALGIETSCDETSVAIVDSNRCIHTNLIYSQYEEHRKHLGVVPEIAARSHLEKLPAMFEAALAEADISMDDIDLIAATAGPGLIGGLHVGLQFAKGLAISTDKPIYAINHLEGHALTPRLVEEVAFPYLLLLVSGGHCQILLVKGVDQYDRWGTTLDDAAGEAFDKVAKMLALGYPGGPAVEKAAMTGDPKAFEFSTPMAKNKSCDFSFSGLKTAVRRKIELSGGLEAMSEQQKADLAASFQDTVARALANRVKRALARFEELHATPANLVVAGGVAANKTIIARLEKTVRDARGLIHAAPLALCTDNAAMIAWAGLEQAALNPRTDLAVDARPRWPLDPNATKSIYAGAAKA